MDLSKQPSRTVAWLQMQCGGFVPQSLRVYISIVFVSFFTLGIAFAEDLEKSSAAAPPCPLSLRTRSADFLQARRSCNFDRRLLPPCAEGQPSLSESRGADGERRLHPLRRQCTREWTVIGYLAMDNNLSEFGEENLSDLFWAKANDPNHHVDLVIQADFKDRPAKRYVFQAQGPGERPTDAVLKDFRETDLNSGDPRELEEYLQWAIEEFPSKHYLVIVGGHGDGWAANVLENQSAAAPQATGRSGHGIAFDEKHNEWITVPELRRVLTRVELLLLNGEPIDIYAADACFMQQAEVVWDLRKQARFLYGSVPVMAYQGLPYAEIIRRLANQQYDSRLASDLTGTSVDGAQRLALDLPQMMVRSYRDKNDRVFASVVDTAEMERTFVRALSKLGDAAIAWLILDPAETMAKQFRLAGIISDSFKHQNAVVELRDFLLQWRRVLVDQPNAPGPAAAADAQKFLVTRDLLSTIDEMEDALRHAVLAWSAGAYFERLGDRFGGLSIWLPSSIPQFMSFQPQVLRSNLHRHFCEGCPTGGLESREEGAEQGNRWHQFVGMIFRPYIPPAGTGNN